MSPRKPKALSKKTPHQRDRIARVLWHPWTIGIMIMLGISPLIWTVIDQSLPEFPELPRQTLKIQQIHFLNQPEYIPSTLKDELFVNSDLLGPIRQTNSPQKIAEVVLQNPWVDDVVRIEMLPGPMVEIECHYRIPIARVATSSGESVIDRDGVLLPVQDLDPLYLSRLIPILDEIQPPEQSAGEYWHNLRLTGAGRLAAEFVDPLKPVSLWQKYGLRSINITPESPDQPWSVETAEYYFVTKSGSRIIWGGIPGIEHQSEPDVSIKLARMKQYFEDYGTFESPTGWHEIDLRPWKHIIRRPLTQTAITPGP